MHGSKCTLSGMMDTTQLFALYMEIMDFLNSCGGKYTVLSERACQSVADSVHTGQYLIQRDEEGKIIQYVAYWKIREEDIAAAYEYVRPADVYCGDIVFTTDYANTGTIKDIYAFFGEMLPAHEPDAIAICHEHKGRFVRWNRSLDGKAWKLERRTRCAAAPTK